jgi:hypothetical protein
MVVSWFDAGDAEKFGQSLAQFFIKRVPLTIEGNKSKSAAKQLAKQFDAVDKMYLQIEEFKLNNRLNIYKKAKLGSAFKLELISAGYDPVFADQVTKGLIQKF